MSFDFYNVPADDATEAEFAAYFVEALKALSDPGASVWNDLGANYDLSTITTTDRTYFPVKDSVVPLTDGLIAFDELDYNDVADKVVLVLKSVVSMNYTPKPKPVETPVTAAA